MKGLGPFIALCGLLAAGAASACSPGLIIMPDPSLIVVRGHVVRVDPPDPQFVEHPPPAPGAVDVDILPDVAWSGTVIIAVEQRIYGRRIGRVITADFAWRLRGAAECDFSPPPPSDGASHTFTLRYERGRRPRLVEVGDIGFVPERPTRRAY